MTSKTISAALACFIAAAPAFADPVSYVFQPEPGTVWSITETRTRTSTVAGKLPLTKVTTAGRLTVVEETDDGYLMEWVIESLSANGVTLKEGDGLTELFIGLPIRFETDESGGPTEVHDAEALIDSAIKTLSKTGTDTSDKQVMDMVRQMFRSPDMMIGAMLPQASLMSNCQGFTLEPGKKQVFDTLSPNVLAGPPIPATTTIELEDKGSATTSARIRIVEAYEPRAAAAAILESLKAIRTQRKLPPLDPSEQIPSLSRISDLACQIDVARGEAVKVVLDMKVDAGALMHQRDVRDIVISRRN
jgi:hypothetical protein